MDRVNDAVFRKPNSQDDGGLVEEAKSLLVRILNHLLSTTAYIQWQNGRDVTLEKNYFNAKFLDSNIAPAVLIYGDAGDGVIHSRAAEGDGIDILSTGPQAKNGYRILILSDGRTGLVFRNVLMRRFIPRDS